MGSMDELGQKTHDDLQALAVKHPDFNSFLHDMQKLADLVWHNAKRQNEEDVAEAQAEDKAMADAEQDIIAQRTAAGNDPGAAPPIQSPPVTEDPAPEGQPVTVPAEPASPVSDAGLPTSNVGVVVSPDPEEGTAVPVEQPDGESPMQAAGDDTEPPPL